MTMIFENTSDIATDDDDNENDILKYLWYGRPPRGCHEGQGCDLDPNRCYSRVIRLEPLDIGYWIIFKSIKY